MIPKEILRKIRQIELRTKRLVSETLAGQYHSVFKGQGMNFDEVREYQPGDEVRTIDWNVTARMNHPFVKKYVEERELTVILLVDVSGSGLFGSIGQSKRELAAEVASVLAFSAIRNNDKVGLILFTDQVEEYIPPRKGRRHVLRVIRDILFHEPKRNGTNLQGALEFMSRVTAHKAIVVILSDFIGANGQPLGDLGSGGRGGARSAAGILRQANRKHDVLAVQVTDRHELEMPALGRLVLQDAETGDIVEINTNDPRKRRAFAERQQRFHLDLSKMFSLAGIDCISLKTEEPYAGALGRFFEARENAGVDKMKTLADNSTPRTNGGALVLPPSAGQSGTTQVPDIRGIKPPVEIASYWPWILTALGVVAFLTWFFWRRKKHPATSPPVPVIPPHRKARESLRNALQLLSDPYAFCSLVSDTTRIYLEERFLLKAPERTTEEFLAELGQSPLLEESHKTLLEEFLRACDMVKFARMEPAEPELRGLLEAALRLIDETQPVDGAGQPSSDVGGAA